MRHKTYYNYVFTTCSTAVTQHTTVVHSLHAAQTYYSYVFHQMQHILHLCISPNSAQTYYIYVFHQIQHRHTTVMCFPKCITNITHNIYVFHQMQHRHTLVMCFSRCCTEHTYYPQSMSMGTHLAVSRAHAHCRVRISQWREASSGDNLKIKATNLLKETKSDPTTFKRDPKDLLKKNNWNQCES